MFWCKKEEKPTIEKKNPDFPFSAVYKRSGHEYSPYYPGTCREWIEWIPCNTDKKYYIGKDKKKYYHVQYNNGSIVYLCEDILQFLTYDSTV